MDEQEQRLKKYYREVMKNKTNSVWLREDARRKLLELLGRKE